MTGLIFGTLLSIAAPGLATDDSAGKLAAAVIAAQSRMTRLEFDCLLFSRDENGNVATDRYHEALASGRRFAETIHLNSPDEPPWRDPYRNRVWGRPDGSTVLRVFERTVRSYGRESVEALRRSPYTDCIGWRPPGEASGPNQDQDGRLFLFDVFDPSQVAGLRLRPAPETVDGLRCTVVEADAGRDILWICPERGHALVRRIIRREDRGEIIEYHAGEFKRVTAGTWLPTVCEGQMRSQKGPARSFRIETRHLAINQAVPDALFQPDFPPGTLVFGSDGRLEQSHSGGAEVLDLWVAVAASLLPPSGQPISPQSGAMVMYLFGAVLLAWGIWLTLLASAREKAREPLTVETEWTDRTTR